MGFDLLNLEVNIRLYSAEYSIKLDAYREYKLQPADNPTDDSIALLHEVHQNRKVVLV